VGASLIGSVPTLGRLVGGRAVVVLQKVDDRLARSRDVADHRHRGRFDTCLVAGVDDRLEGARRDLLAGPGTPFDERDRRLGAIPASSSAVV